MARRITKSPMAYITTARVPMGEMQFKLTFVAEAVIPVDIGLTSVRVKTYEKQRNQ